MPFTFAHPAAAVPLRRLLGRAGVLSALVIGSMAPDLTYFVPFGVDRASTHSLAGVLWFCLPLGFLTYHIFNFLVRPVIYVLLPPSWRDRLAPLSDSPFQTRPPTWAVLVSIVVGALTHLLWDAWTHGDGFFVVNLPILQTRLGRFYGYRITLYKVLQHGSTLLGFVCLGLWVKKYWDSVAVRSATRFFPAVERLRVPVLLALVTVSAILGMTSGLAHGQRANGIHAFQLFLGYGVIRASSVCGGLLIALGALLRFHTPQWPVASPEPQKRPSRIP